MKSQDVKILTTDGDTSAVTGVQANQQLVTDSFDKLQNGTKISIRKPGQSVDPGKQAHATPPAKDAKGS